jgi:dolichol-phosphate mannosyltransferase
MPSLVVVPTYDEAPSLESFVGQVLVALPGSHVLIVDDASPDGTGLIADELAKRDGRVFALHRPAKLGIGSAYVAGFSWGMARAYDRFLEMDADFSHDPRFLGALMAALDAGADVAVGSRNMRGGAIVGWGPGRYLLSKGGSLYARLILQVGVSDMTTGFKAYTRAALERLDVGSISSNGYAFQIETTYRALRAGLRIVEVPIVFVDRRAGRSKMTWREIMGAAFGVWRMRAQR